MNTGKRSILPANPNKTVLVAGATSSLAQALCRTLAARGRALVLTGRDEGELELLASDLKTRFGTDVRFFAADMMGTGFSAVHFIAQAGNFDAAIIAIGGMNDELIYSTYVNYTLPAMLAAAAAEKLALTQCGSVIIISSVAGDRGRQGNYIYGSAKAALTAFASGLRNRYAKQGVHVMTVKPGFIDTPMTWGMKSPLVASREYVAGKIADAMEKKKDVIYVPWFWRWIMLIIVSIPERIFKRLSL